MAKVWRKGKGIKAKGKFHCSMEVTVMGKKGGGGVLCGKITESEAGSMRGSSHLLHLLLHPA